MAPPGSSMPPPGPSAWPRARSARRRERPPVAAGRSSGPAACPGRRREAVAAGGQREGDGCDSHGEHDGGGHRRLPPRSGPQRSPGAARAPGRPGESVPAERPGLAEHGGPVRARARLRAGRERDRVRLEAGRHALRALEGCRRPGGERRARRQIEQHGGAKLDGAPGAAGGAALDVLVDALAQPDGQAPVPAGEHDAELAAVAAPGAGDKQHSEAGLQGVARPGEQRVGVVARHAEHTSRLGRLQALPELQLDDLALTGAQACAGAVEQRAQITGRGDRAARGVRAAVRAHAGRLVQRRCPRPGPGHPPGFVPGHGIEPGAEPVLVSPGAEPGRGDDERVLHGIRGVGRIAQQRPAVPVEGVCVPVIGRGEPFGIAGHDGRDNLAVAHLHTGEVLSIAGGGRGSTDVIPTSLT